MLLQDVKVNIKIKLAALWASVMFLYIYADYFGLFIPGALQEMLTGRIGPFPHATQGVLVFTASMMAIPSVMIFLSIVLKASVNRPLNIVIGVLYTVIILFTMWSWIFFIVYGVIEIILTGLVVWYAWTWPRDVSSAA
jgi:hypothetical protein